MKIGEQLGLISYNETIVKKFIVKYLTTMSTDFKIMGNTAAKLVLNSSKADIKNPFELVLRGTLQ